MTRAWLQGRSVRSAAAALLVLLACHGARGETALEVEAVRDLMDSGDYAEAIETATDLLTVEAGRDDILNILGEAQFAVGQLDAAGSSFVRAYALNGDGRLRAMGNLGALDFAGGTVVHISSGVAALAAATAASSAESRFEFAS